MYFDGIIKSMWSKIKFSNIFAGNYTRDARLTCDPQGNVTGSLKGYKLYFKNRFYVTLDLLAVKLSYNFFGFHWFVV